MPSKKSPEIDYDGNEVCKYIKKSSNPEKIIEDCIQLSSRITSCKTFKGYIQYHTKNKYNEMILNMFIRNITYDISDKTFRKRKITTGNTGNPFETSKNDTDLIKTFLIGVYVFEEHDDYKKAILISFPIVEDIKYESNSSISFPIDLIKIVRLSTNPKEWGNKKKRRFIAFKPISFYEHLHQIYNVSLVFSNSQPLVVPIDKTLSNNFPKKSKNDFKRTKQIDKIFFHEVITGIIVGGNEGPFIRGEDIKFFFDDKTISAVNNKLKKISIDVSNYIPNLIDKIPVDVVQDARKCAKKIINVAGNGTDILWTGLNNHGTDIYGTADIVATFSNFGTLGISLKKGKGQLKNLGVETVFKTLGLPELTSEYFIKRYIENWNEMTTDWCRFLKIEFQKQLIDPNNNIAEDIFNKHLKLNWLEYQSEKISKRELKILNEAINHNINITNFKDFCRKIYEDYGNEWNSKRDAHFDKIFKDFPKEYDKKIKSGLMNLFHKQLSMCNDSHMLYVANGGDTFWFIPSKKELVKKFGKEFFFGEYKTQTGGSGYEFIIEAYNKNKQLVGQIMIIFRFGNGQMNGFPTTKSRYKLNTADGWSSILGGISNYYD